MAFSAWQLLSPVQWARWTWSAVRGGGAPEGEDGGVGREAEEDSPAESKSQGFRQVRGRARSPWPGCMRGCAVHGAPAAPGSPQPRSPLPASHRLWLLGSAAPGGAPGRAGWLPAAARQWRALLSGRRCRRAPGTEAGSPNSLRRGPPSPRGGCRVPGGQWRMLGELGVTGRAPAKRPPGARGCAGGAADPVSPALPFPFASVACWKGEGRPQDACSGLAWPGSRSGWMCRRCGGFRS